MHWIDPFLKSLSNAITASDENAWQPFDPYANTWPYYSRQWMDYLYNAFETSKRRSLSPKQLAGGFLGLLFLRQEMLNTVLMSKMCGYDKEKTMQLLAWFRDILFEKCSADPFGFESNQILGKEDLKYLMQMFPFHEPSLEEAREAGRLVAACEQLSFAYIHGLELRAVVRRVWTV